MASIYQSTGSLHSDGQSSNSMSPAPSPSPTQHPSYRHRHYHPHGRASTAPVRTPATALRDGIVMPGAPPASPSTMANGPQTPRSNNNNNSLSGSMSNLSLSGSRKWNSTSDFRDQQSPAAMGR